MVAKGFTISALCFSTDFNTLNKVKLNITDAKISTHAFAGQPVY